MKISSLDDVARKAGVSTATASHALNGKGRVNQETRARIVRIAKKLGYAPNRNAVGLITGRTGILAVQIGRPGPASLLVPTPAYFTELVNSISAAALNHGWIPVIVPRDIPIVDLRKLNPDCGIVIDPLGSETLLKMLLDVSAPVVTTGRLDGPSRNEAVVHIDNDVMAATFAALEHLWQAGYRRPALLVTRSSASYVTDSISAARCWSKQQGTPIQVIRSTYVSISAAEKKLMRRFTAGNSPDAIYATDEPGALAALRAALAGGIRVPEDLGIISGLDGPLLRDGTIPITALNIHPELIGREAVRRLFDIAMSQAADRKPSCIPFTLHVRRSTARK
jgi:DNA-binding LacI/PurR family transcriptional regulator